MKSFMPLRLHFQIEDVVAFIHVVQKYCLLQPPSFEFEFFAH